MGWSQPIKGLYIYIHQDYVFSRKFALFDLDWTLVKPRFGKFPSNPEDNVIMEGRISKLKELVSVGYNIIIFTNQKITARESSEYKISRMNDVISKFLAQGIVLTIFMATQDDGYRKPETGMWDLLFIMFKDIGFIISKEETFYCGDAAGRPADFSDSDIKFAKNIGVKFILPEDIFGT